MIFTTAIIIFLFWMPRTSTQAIEYLESQNLISMHIDLDVGHEIILNFRLANNTDRIYMSGYRFSLYHRTRTGWVLVPFRENRGAFFALGFSIFPNEYHEGVINLSDSFHNLPYGEYRIIKRAHLINDHDNPVKVVGQFEFR